MKRLFLQLTGVLFAMSSIAVVLFGVSAYRAYRALVYADARQNLVENCELRRTYLEHRSTICKQDIDGFGACIQHVIQDDRSPTVLVQHYNAMLEYALTHTSIKRFVVVGPTGNVIISSVPEVVRQGMDYASSIFYSETIRTNFTARTRPVYAPCVYNYGRPFTLPIYRAIGATNELVCVVIVEFDERDWMRGMLETTLPGARNYVEIVDERTSQLNPELLKGHLTPAMKAIRSRSQGVLYDAYDADSNKVVAAYTYIPQMGWGIAVMNRVDDLDAICRKFMSESRLYLPVVFFVLLLSAVVIAHSMTRPMERIRLTVQAFRLGNLAERTGVVRNDEIGMLASAFDTALDQVQKEHQIQNELKAALVRERDQLEVTVEERTAQLRESEEKFKTIADYTVNWELWVSPRGQVIWTNKCCESICGYTPEELMKASRFWELLTAHVTLDKFILHFSRALQGGSGDAVEFCCRKKDGTIFWVEASWKPVYRGDQTFLGARISMKDVTEQRETKFLVQRMANAMENAADGMVIVDGAGSVMYANAAYEKICGYSRQEIVGSSGFATLHYLAQDAALRNAFWSAMLNGQPWQGVFTETRKDGSPYMLQMVAAPVLDEEGKILYYVSSLRDVTVETENMRIAQRFQNIFNQSMMPMLITDVNHRVTDVNDAGLRTHFVQREHVVGRLISEVMLPPSFLEVANKCAQQLKSENFAYATYPIQEPDGRIRTYGVTVANVQNGAGCVTDHFALCRDVTEEIHAQERVFQLSQVIEQSMDAIGILNPDLSFVYVNAAYQTLTGYGAANLVDTHLSDLVLCDSRHVLTATICDALRAGIAWSGLLVYTHTLGHLCQVDFHASPIRDKQGVLRYYAIIQRDVTREKQLEEHIQQTQKMESIGRLAGGVAHDFNNMLQGILGFAELLEMDTVEQPLLHGHAREICKTAKRAQSLTRQLLVFGRRQAFTPVLLNLQDQLAVIQKMLQRIVGDVTITRTVSPGLFPVRVDPGQFEQVVMNLVVNAREAISDLKHGLIEIILENTVLDAAACVAHVAWRPGSFVRLSVRDNGVGIAPDLRTKIFEPFYTTKQRDRASGLGLPVVYGIMKQHEGWVEVDSEEGKGSRFTLYFPAVLDEVVEVRNTPIPDEFDDADVMGHGETVLVVEDEDVVLRMVETVFQTSGYRVLCAATLSEGRTLFDAHRDTIGALFSDVILPDGNGLDLADHLRQVAPALPVVLCSGYTRDVLKGRSLVQDHYLFLAKPYTRQQALGALRDAIQAVITREEKAG